MAEVTASDLAKHIIDSFASKGESITNLKLQKLLYYTQAWHLALHGRVFFNDRIEAWVHGPVVPSVFQEYRSFKWTSLKIVGGYSVNSGVVHHTSKVLEQYGRFDAYQLERLTHSEHPWKNARTGIEPDVASHREIEPKVMLDYYRSRLNG
jgi:uncharacterized phage-associated protein